METNKGKNQMLNAFRMGYGAWYICNVGKMTLAECFAYAHSHGKLLTFWSERVG